MSEVPRVQEQYSMDAIAGFDFFDFDLNKVATRLGEGFGRSNRDRTASCLLGRGCELRG